MLDVPCNDEKSYYIHPLMGASCAMDRMLDQMYNTSGRKWVGIMKLAELCGRIVAGQKRLDVPICKPARSMSYGASNREAQDMLGWSPTTSLRNGLREIMKSFWGGSAEASDKDPAARARSVE